MTEPAPTEDELRARTRVWLAFLSGTGPKPPDWDELHAVVPGTGATGEYRMNYGEWQALPAGERRRLMVEWVEAQGHVCGLCRNPLDVDTTVPEDRPVVDHLHGPDGDGPVRGVLHSSCNLHLSTVESRGSRWTEKAVLYLRQRGWGAP